MGPHDLDDDGPDHFDALLTAAGDCVAEYLDLREVESFLFRQPPAEPVATAGSSTDNLIARHLRHVLRRLHPAITAVAVFRSGGLTLSIDGLGRSVATPDWVSDLLTATDFSHAAGRPVYVASALYLLRDATHRHRYGPLEEDAA